MNGRGPWVAGARRGDAFATGALLLLATAAAWIVAGDAAAYIRGDWPTIFLSPYVFLGERLRALDLPGWNPHQFSGVPFAGDPSSGWGYLPAMLSYALFRAEAATTVFIGLHFALSALAAYILARLTGLGVGGAFVAGAAYACPWLIAGAASMVLFFQIHAWLPVALIGIELARGSPRPSARWAGVALSGLAISQLLAAWLGQGSYYALLVVGGWVAWRTLVTPPAGWTVRHRLAGMAGIGGAILVAGFGLNAMALLVRLDANARSNVPGGAYRGLSRWEEAGAARSLEEIVQGRAGGFSEASWSYLGAAVLALALLAPLLAPRWEPLGFWLIVAVVALVLATGSETPIRAAMEATLPRFELIHGHLPGRVLMVASLAAAMLAGAAVDALTRWTPDGRRWRWLLAIPVVLLAAGFAAGERAELISRGSLAAALAALALCAVAVAAPIARRAVALPLALAIVVVWDPAGRAMVAGWGPQLGHQRSLEAAVEGDADGFLHRNGAAAFLADATRSEPGRYAGYDPALLPLADIAAGRAPRQAYRNHWLGSANWLLTQNWGTWFGLDDVQGYNPVQVGRYTEYIDALNGHPQEYHETDVFPAGLDSPLLNPLNLRYFVVPADAPERDDLAPLLAAMPTVYEDERVRILENAEAYPRAWLVHETRQVGAGEALALLADVTFDPRRTALLETQPPALGAPPDADAESAAYRVYEPERLVVEVVAGSPALLVLSEVWDPGWSATVDGAPTPVLPANHVFRAVPVPAGQHTVELRYDPPGLRLGLGITATTAAILAVVWVGLRGRERARPSPRDDS